jgi:hypothetical protein
MQPARAAAPRPIGTDFPVLIHFHIYKNAGSSIDRLLAESFGDAWTTFEDPSHDIIDCHRLRRLLAARPGLRAVSSHRFRAPLPCRSARPMVMLRHPVDRARSIYHFARRDPTQHDHAVARNGSFADYVEHYLPQKDAGVVIRDYQVVHLSDASMRCRHNTQLARATPATWRWSRRGSRNGACSGWSAGSPTVADCSPRRTRAIFPNCACARSARTCLLTPR